MDADVKGGAIFYSEDQLLLFGGEPEDLDTRSAYPGKAQISRLQLKDNKGFEMTSLSNDGKDVNRFVTKGAYTSVPGEKLGFLFGGLRNKDWEEIRTTGRVPYYAIEYSDRLIKVDMNEYRDESWSYETIPKDVSQRYDASLTWVPRGEKGSLVLIGGAVDGLYMSTYMSAAINITKEDTAAAVS